VTWQVLNSQLFAMLREPGSIAAIDSLNVIGQPIPQPIERIDIDRGFAPIDARQESL
jgi:hypothetical protein